MKKKGAVICFQKYNFSDLNISSKIPAGHVCLGYFGRMDVSEVDSFKDYIRVASEHGAEFQCSRKQILVYQLEEKYDCGILVVPDKTCVESEHEINKGIPFQPTDATSQSGCEKALCCCTVLTISRAFADAYRDNYIRMVADKLLTDLGALCDTKDLRFGILGVLGAEDLCIILLSNEYAAISDSIDIIQTCQLKLNDTDTAPILVVDNTHSILTIAEPSCNNQVNWGDQTHADIYFSLKSLDGIQYIKNNIVEPLKSKFSDSASSISLESWLGEYDAVLRCPASCLNSDLFYSKDGPGLISYSNKEYCNAVYQSETIIYPFGHIDTPANTKKIQSKASTPDNMVGFVKDTIKLLRLNILGAEDDPKKELVYVEAALYRLLKDYHSIYSYPYSTELCKDLPIQFQTALGAICTASEQVKNQQNDFEPAELVGLFIEDFDYIANALSAAMQAAGQFDRLNYDEQPSYILNIGSYNKILRSYYGIIKDILKLLYAIKRDSTSKQNILIPILYFGQTPIVTSKSFPSVYNSNGMRYDAQLICITLPYQALANPPKYLGVLVHELFHYSAPISRNERNRIEYESLLNLALCEFISNLASGIPEGRCEKGYGIVFRRNFSELVEEFCAHQTEADFKNTPSFKSMASYDFKEEICSKLIFSRDPMTESYQFYREVWKLMRKMIISADNYTNYGPVIEYIFALKEDLPEQDTLNKSFSNRVSAVISFQPLQNLVLSFFDAFVEVSPDISDLGIVLKGEDHQTWAKQYFWQITSIRGDLQFGINSSVEQPEEVIKQISNKMDSNSIRIGIILSYCLGSSSGIDSQLQELRDYLALWCKTAQGNSTAFLTAQEQFYYDYCTYLEQAGFLANHTKLLCEQATTALTSLSENPELSAIINSFSTFYKRYYNELQERQSFSNTEFDRRLFILCTDVIENYQVQIPLFELCELNIPQLSVNFSPVPSCVSKVNVFEPQCHFAVNHPADLARAIKTAYDSMSVAEKIPALWYRGQRIYTRPSLPNIMRKADSTGSGFFNQLHEEVRIARSQILPVGSDFCPAEWLAFLQHNEFKTNILDFSEELHPALYFAIERWSDHPSTPPEQNACIEIFNPLLFNLAMDALDECDKAPKETTAAAALESYLKHGCLGDGRRVELPLFASGEDNSAYNGYFDYQTYTNDRPIQRPRAALVPKNSERMKRQSGQFVFYDLHTKPTLIEGKYSYQKWSLKELHKEYLSFAKANLFSTNPEDLAFVRPFLFQMEIDSFYYMEFVKYIKAIGLCKHRVYPEFDKLAADLRLQLELD